MEATSLGLIEIVGYVAAIEASDAGCKAANVRLLGYERGRAGLFTVKFAGDVAAVRAAVTAASVAAERIGKVVAVHVIAHPDRQLHVISNSEQAQPKAVVEQVTALTEVVEVVLESNDAVQAEVSKPDMPSVEQSARDNTETSVSNEPDVAAGEEQSTSNKKKESVAPEQKSEPSPGATRALDSRRKGRVQKGKGRKNSK